MMNNKNPKPKISVVIPVYNEEKTIGKVLATVTKSPLVDEIIVINDGSTDATLAEIKKLKNKVQITSYKKNKGKGYALWTGIKKAKGEIILFLDADLVNFKQSHIKKLLQTISKRPNDLVIGIVENACRLVGPKLAMLPGGIRIFRKSVLKKSFVNQWPKFGHAVDLMITDYFKKKKGEVWLLKLPGLNHQDKHLKHGLKVGLKENIVMYTQIAKVIPKLQSWSALVKNNQIID